MHSLAGLEMMRGYMDALAESRVELPEDTNYTESYRHGWLCGRDDRLNKPHAAADMLRRKAEQAAIKDMKAYE